MAEELLPIASVVHRECSCLSQGLMSEQKGDFPSKVIFTPFLELDGQMAVYTSFGPQRWLDFRGTISNGADHRHAATMLTKPALRVREGEALPSH